MYSASRVEWLKPGDPILSAFKGSVMLEKGDAKGFILFTGRGMVESVDRAWIIANTPEVNEVLFIGTSASLDPGLPPGSINIPLYSILPLDPTFTYAGLLQGLPVADRDLAARLAENAKKLGGNVAMKLHVSIPYFFAETRKMLEYLSGIGAATLDMELAGVLRC
jgi:purine-nucleoside phosphorylase